MMDFFRQIGYYCKESPGRAGCAARDQAKEMALSERIVIMHQRVRPGSGKDEEDTLAQAAFVARTLKESGIRPSILTVDLNLRQAARRLNALRPDIVFNLVESLEGKGEFIHYAAGLLESLAIPFTGAPARALYASSHKLLAKEILRQAGIRTPDWFLAPSNGTRAESAFFPCIRKSIWEHASLGMDDDAVITKTQELTSHLTRNGFFYERFVDGREFNIALLEEGGIPRALPAVEIRFVDFPPDKPRIVGYRAKWEQESFEYINTVHRIDFPDTDLPLLDELGRTALACWDVFGLAGYARVDFRVDGDGVPWVLEINANPCLMPDAGFYKTALRAGYDRRTLIRTLVDAARAKTAKE